MDHPIEISGKGKEENRFENVPYLVNNSSGLKPH